MASKKIAHTIPLIMTVDETFDIGLDTGTGVDNSYQLPFKFTGTIDKLTIKLGPSQMSAADKKAAEEAYAKSTTNHLPTIYSRGGRSGITACFPANR